MTCLVLSSFAGRLMPLGSSPAASLAPLPKAGSLSPLTSPSSAGPVAILSPRKILSPLPPLKTSPNVAIERTAPTLSSAGSASSPFAAPSPSPSSGLVPVSAVVPLKPQAISTQEDVQHHEEVWRPTPLRPLTSSCNESPSASGECFYSLRSQGRSLIMVSVSTASDHKVDHSSW
jgi:hypothetical protein